MVLCNVQVQVMLVWEVLLALAAAVHVHLAIVHVVLLNRRKRQRVVRGQRALHNGVLVRHGAIGVELDYLDVGRRLTQIRCAALV